MTIRLGLRVNRSNGGPMNFMRRLCVTLEKDHHYEIVDPLNPRAEIALVLPFTKGIAAKKRIYRLDGIPQNINLGPKRIHERRSALARCIRKADGIVFQSAFSRDSFRRYIWPLEGPNVIINNGAVVEWKKNKAGNIRLRKTSETFHLIAVAKWNPWKRLRETLDVFDIVRKNVPQRCILHVIGPLLEECPTNQTYTDVVFYGPKSWPFIQEKLAQAHLMISLSYFDNCPNAVVEALAQRVPVVCTNIGGTKELIGATNGGVVVNAEIDNNLLPFDSVKPPQIDIEKIANEIVRLLTNTPYVVDPTCVDISNVAQRYDAFIKTII